MSSLGSCFLQASSAVQGNLGPVRTAGCLRSFCDDNIWTAALMAMVMILAIILSSYNRRDTSNMNNTPCRTMAKHSLQSWPYQTIHSRSMPIEPARTLAISSNIVTGLQWEHGSAISISTVFPRDPCMDFMLQRCHGRLGPRGATLVQHVHHVSNTSSQCTKQGKILK